MYPAPSMIFVVLRLTRYDRRKPGENLGLATSESPFDRSIVLAMYQG
jgi:hypothetical protein